MTNETIGKIVMLGHIWRFQSALRKRRIPRLILGALVVAGVGLGLHLILLQLSGNFHEIVPGELYRSAQPSPERLATYQREFGIKTIINLRGERNGRSWYDDEIAAARRLGIAHVDYRMSSSRELTQQRAAELLAILKKAQKPILVHCQRGADRSGLVSALYVAQIAQQGEEAAEEQISLRYGHIAIPLLSAPFALDSAWEKLEPWLGFNSS